MSFDRNLPSAGTSAIIKQTCMRRREVNQLVADIEGPAPIRTARIRSTPPNPNIIQGFLRSPNGRTFMNMQK